MFEIPNTPSTVERGSASTNRLLDFNTWTCDVAAEFDDVAVLPLDDALSPGNVVDATMVLADGIHPSLKAEALGAALVQARADQLDAAALNSV